MVTTNVVMHREYLDDAASQTVVRIELIVSDSEPRIPTMDDAKRLAAVLQAMWEEA